MRDKPSLFAIQLALFIDNGSVHADELSYLVRSKMNIGRFEPMLIPEQGIMPAEIPRLNINSDDGYRLSLSKVRLDFVLEIPFGINDNTLDVFFGNCKTLCEILEERNVVLSRIGLVKNWFIPEDRPAVGLAEKLLSVPVAEISDVSVSVTKKKDIDGMVCNSLYAFMNGMHQSGGSGWVVSRDVNNVPSADIRIKSGNVPAMVQRFNQEASDKSVADFVEGR